MLEILGLVVSAAVPLIGVVVWLVRLEGRLNTEKELRMALEGRINGFEQRVYLQLDRIEHKIDEKADR